MKTYSALKVAFAAGGMALLMTSCGITGGSNGDEKAAMSCMQDIATGLDSANNGAAAVSVLHPSAELQAGLD